MLGPRGRRDGGIRPFPKGILMGKKQRRSFKQNTLAIVYDFDGTLCPKPMQEYTVLPKLGIDGKTFRNEVEEEWRREAADPMLTYRG